MRLTKGKLQAKLNALASAVNRAQDARSAIYAHCEAVYGVNPGDIDNDDFIDACDGGCGAAIGMTADQFDKSMRDAMAQAGLSAPRGGD